MRHNFTTPQQRQINERSHGVCEAGKFETEAFYGMAPGETCTRPAEEIDHITADALKRSRIKDIDEGLHVCRLHHKIKTADDMKKIAKAVRLEESKLGIKKASRPIPGSKTSGWKKSFSGEVTRR